MFHQATDFEWKPAQADDYITLANLALAMNDAKDPELPAELGATADDLFGKVKDVAWHQDHIEAINQFAIDHLEDLRRGRGLRREVKDNKVQPNGEVVFLFLIGNTPAVVRTSDPTAANLGIEARMLVFGRITDQKPRLLLTAKSRAQVIVAIT